MEFDAEAPVAYLGGDDVIDVEHPKVQELVMHLAGQAPAPVEYARSAFTWVRDNIRHSLDAQDSRVTITASQTLHEGVGLCFAKAHLLAALLRARGIPTGLCYQRLADGTGYCVHGRVKSAGVVCDG